jgi:KaiC/GvpD/RAD55 family RecA-like ATPase
VFSKWDFTILATSQYAISTAEAFGFGIEHIADGIIRFRRSVKGGRLRRFLMIEKMRQTNHDLRMYEIEIIPGKGMEIVGPAEVSKEDYALPKKVMEKIAEAKRRSESEVP